MDLLKEGHIQAGFITTPLWKGITYLPGVAGPLAIANADNHILDLPPPTNEWGVPLQVNIWDNKYIANTYSDEQILKDLGHPYMVTTYSHVDVGFAMRRGVKTEAEAFAAKKAVFIQAITWFTEFVIPSRV